VSGGLSAPPIIAAAYERLLIGAGESLSEVSIDALSLSMPHYNPWVRGVAQAVQGFSWALVGDP
jgi:hypothetical protein